MARRAREGRLEPLVLRLDPLVVLANQLVALANEYAGLDREWARAVVKRAGCFLDLEDTLFDAAWDTLLDVKTLFPHGQRPEGGWAPARVEPAPPAPRVASWQAGNSYDEADEDEWESFAQARP